MDYRINGFRQISAFYEWLHNNQDKPVKPHHISIYLYLVHISNKANWAVWVRFPYRDAMNNALIGSKKTYYKAIEELAEWGLIEYKKGKNGLEMPSVSLIQLYDNEQVPIQVPAPLPTQVGTQVPAPLGTPIYITDNNKQVTGNTPESINLLERNSHYKRPMLKSGELTFYDNDFLRKQYEYEGFIQPIEKAFEIFHEVWVSKRFEDIKHFNNWFLGLCRERSSLTGKVKFVS